MKAGVSSSDLPQSRLGASYWHLQLTKLGTGDWELVTGDWALGTGDCGLGTGDWGLRTGDWGLRTGDWGLGTGDWGLGFASQEDLGELCSILDEDLQSYAGFCFPGGALGVMQDFR